MPEVDDDHYRIALFARPARSCVILPIDRSGYHFMRQNADGTWSHKPGEMAVTNLDESGNIIHDPRNAVVGEYLFIAFALVPKGGLDVGPKDSSNGVPNGNDPDYGHRDFSSVNMKSF